MNEEVEVNLFITRHGKTELNNSNKIQGWVDSPLTDDGIEIANYLGQGIKDIEFKKAYSSDLGRASNTLDIILKKNLKNNIDIERKKGLREWNFGSFESEPADYMKESLAEKLGIDKEEVFIYDLEIIANALFEIDPENESENWSQLEERFTNSLEEIVNDMLVIGGGNALIVSHGLAIASILRIIDKSYNLEKPLENASITEVIYKNGEYKIIDSNNIDYIRKGKMNI